MKTILMLVTVLGNVEGVAPVMEYQAGHVESCIADSDYLSEGYGEAFCVPADDMGAPRWAVVCAFADQYPTDTNVERCDMRSEGRHYAKFR